MILEDSYETLNEKVSLKTAYIVWFHFFKLKKSGKIHAQMIVIDFCKCSVSGFPTKNMYCYIIINFFYLFDWGKDWKGFPGGSMIKNHPASAGGSGSVPE